MAFLGKGGAGKTALAALTARVIIGEGGSSLLLVDADPAMGLAPALGLKEWKSLGRLRDQMTRDLQSDAAGAGERLSLMSDYFLGEALMELPGLSLLVMGMSEAAGCFCPLNSLLKSGIEEMAGRFDFIVVDAQAGVEQVSRQVTRAVDYPLIVCDATGRGLMAAKLIGSALERFHHAPAAGVIANRVSAPEEGLRAKLDEAGLSFLGAVPEDGQVARSDLSGRSLLEIPLDSPAPAAIRNILRENGIIEP
jgi:CO dehydrogenase maturation factor